MKGHMIKTNITRAIFSFIVIIILAQISNNVQAAVSAESVKIEEDASLFTISNGIVTSRISKRNGDMTSLLYKGTETLTEKSGHTGGYCSHDTTGGIDTITKITIDPHSNDGALTYIHKVKDSKDIYFFANSTNQPVDMKVFLRSNKSLALWSPHTGKRSELETDVSDASGKSVTTAPLVLEPLKSVFYVQQ
ncbi:MAG: hypothetical protein P8016_04585 [Sedimentisphaerales bacterium]